MQLLSFHSSSATDVVLSGALPIFDSIRDLYNVRGHVRLRPSEKNLLRQREQLEKQVVVAFMARIPPGSITRQGKTCSNCRWRCQNGS
jgi:hypothetical protein